MLTWQHVWEGQAFLDLSFSKTQLASQLLLGGSLSVRDNPIAPPLLHFRLDQRIKLLAQSTCTVFLDEFHNCASQDANLFAELLKKVNNSNIVAR